MSQLVVPCPYAGSTGTVPVSLLPSSSPWGEVNSVSLRDPSTPRSPRWQSLSRDTSTCNTAPAVVATRNRTGTASDEHLTIAVADGPLAMLANALRRGTPPASASALIAAYRVAKELDLASAHPTRVAISRVGCISFTLVSGRRFATFECDDEGDVVVTFSDRATNEEAIAKVVPTGEIQPSISLARRFLES